MKLLMRNCILGGVLGSFAWTAVSAGVIPKDVSLAPVVKQVSPAVVNIATRGTVEVRSPLGQDPNLRRFFGIPDQPVERETGSLGSGVIVDADEGYVLTNYHVVANADEITINLIDGREFAAELIGSDELSDLAVLKVDGEDLAALSFGDSDSLEVGDYVLAVGNPFGLGHTVTSGIVSAKGRALINSQNYEDFIQTDAAINRGNSGGALVNLQGELIGINTAILGPAGGNVGIGFAIPGLMAQNVMDQIIDFGQVSRGLLGVTGQPLTPEIADQLGLETAQGAVVTRVLPDSGAQDAGLQELDVIVEAEGRKVSNFNDLRNIIGLKRPGDKVELTLIRDGKRRSETAILTANDNAVAATSNGSGSATRDLSLGGARLANLPEDHPLSGTVEGVVVMDIENGSPAARAGLQPGDVITAINRTDIATVADAVELIEDDEQYLVKVRRGEGAFFVVID